MCSVCATLQLQQLEVSCAMNGKCGMTKAPPQMLGQSRYQAKHRVQAKKSSICNEMHAGNAIPLKVYLAIFALGLRNSESLGTAFDNICRTRSLQLGPKCRTSTPVRTGEMRTSGMSARICSKCFSSVLKYVTLYRVVLGTSETRLTALFNLCSCRWCWACFQAGSWAVRCGPGSTSKYRCYVARLAGLYDLQACWFTAVTIS